MVKQRSNKVTPPKNIYVVSNKYGSTLYKDIEEAFEAGENVVDIYTFDKKQRIVVKVEDL